MPAGWLAPAPVRVAGDTKSVEAPQTRRRKEGGRRAEEARGATRARRAPSQASVGVAGGGRKRPATGSPTPPPPPPPPPPQGPCATDTVTDTHKAGSEHPGRQRTHSADEKHHARERRTAADDGGRQRTPAKATRCSPRDGGHARGSADSDARPRMGLTQRLQRRSLNQWLWFSREYLRPDSLSRKIYV